MKLPVDETIALTEDCSGILKHKLPSKLKDPESLTVTCSIEIHVT